jgi:hypothetical protein
VDPISWVWAKKHTPLQSHLHNYATILPHLDFFNFNFLLGPAACGTHSVAMCWPGVRDEPPMRDPYILSYPQLHRAAELCRGGVLMLSEHFIDPSSHTSKNTIISTSALDCATRSNMQVPVFKVIKGKDGKHEVLDMVVQIMLNGDVSLSWTKGDNSQIVPTETQKNTCYAIALQLNFNRSVDRAAYMAVASHRHPPPLSSHHCHPPTAAAASTHHQLTTTNPPPPPSLTIFPSSDSAAIACRLYMSLMQLHSPPPPPPDCAAAPKSTPSDSHRTFWQDTNTFKGSLSTWPVGDGNACRLVGTLTSTHSRRPHRPHGLRATSLSRATVHRGSALEWTRCG